MSEHKCPTCEKEGYNSRVSFRSSWTIGDLANVPNRFIDAEGKHHYHSKNYNTMHCNCSRGHSWSVKDYPICTTCGWVAEKEEVKVLDIVTIAREIATKAHEGQKRWNGDPYITHPEAVVKILQTQDLYDPAKKYYAVGYLHDVLEDTKITVGDLSSAGMPNDVIEAVRVLTRREGQTYTKYIMGICQNKYAKVVKLADLEHNLSDLEPGLRRDKYELAKLYISSK